MRSVALMGLILSSGCRSVFGLDDPQLQKVDAAVIDATIVLPDGGQWHR